MENLEIIVHWIVYIFSDLIFLNLFGWCINPLYNFIERATNMAIADCMLIIIELIFYGIVLAILVKLYDRIIKKIKKKKRIKDANSKLKELNIRNQSNLDSKDNYDKLAAKETVTEEVSTDCDEFDTDNIDDSDTESGEATTDYDDEIKDSDVSATDNNEVSSEPTVIENSEKVQKKSDKVYDKYGDMEKYGSYDIIDEEYEKSIGYK